MKITQIILALLAAGFLGQAALGADMNNGWNTPQQNLALIPDGHGGSHFLYYQQNNNMQGGQSVALSTATGGVTNVAPMLQQTGVLADSGQTRFVMGTNQHGVANGAYIPVTSHFAQSGK